MQWHMPIGYIVKDGNIIINEESQAIVRQIFKDYDNGISAIRIAASLKEKGIPNANGKVAWTHASIGRILENHKYLGTEYYPRLIKEELFWRVQEKREQTRKSLGRGKHRPDKKKRILFGGILICGTCGAPCSHIQPKDKARKNDKAKWKCKNYIYHNRLSCAGGFITDSQVMEVCTQAINHLLQDKHLMEHTEDTEERFTRRFRELDARIHNPDKVTIEERIPLLYERASERYRTLKVRDGSQRTKEMRQALEGREPLEAFDEELYRRLVSRIIVYKDFTVKVVFHNHSSIRLGYGEKADIQKGAEDGSQDSKESVHDPCQPPV